MTLQTELPTHAGLAAGIDPGGAELLLPWLASQQRRVLGIVAGLDERALRRVVLASGWSCAGMIQHLTRMNEFWFVHVMGGVPIEESDDDFVVADDCSPADLVTAYEVATRAHLALVRDLPLDTPPAWWPEDMFGPWRLDNLLEVLLHVIIETACHAGHLDAARELIDGGTWDYSRRQVRRPS